MADLIAALPGRNQPTLIAPPVGAEFEFGTEKYRAHVYASTVAQSVPPGTPLIVSDDSAAWRAAHTLSDSYPFVGVLHSDDAVYYDYARRYGSAVSAWVCVSSRVSQRLRGVALAGHAPVEIIPCGVPLPRLIPRTERPEASLRLVWVGRVEERQKRVTDLPRIAAELRRTGTPFSLDVLGDGDALSLLQDLIRDSGLGEAVRLHGWCNAARVGEVLADSDVLLLPSNFEGMPVVAMEAMASGCGVVASRVSGLEDYANAAESKDCLWMHDVGDIPGAAAAVRASREVLPSRRAAAARKLAEREFAIGVCVERYERLLAKLPTIHRGETRRLRSNPLATIWSHAVAATRIARVRIRETAAASGTAHRADTRHSVEVSHARA